MAFRRSPAWALTVVSIVYQYVSCSIAVMQPQYVQNVVIFQLFLVAATLGPGLAFVARRA